MNSLKSLPLMTPRASIPTTSETNERWYSMCAAARGVVDMHLHGEIGAWGITARQFAQDLKALGDVSQINLHVHSPGGDVFEGIAIYNILKHHPARVDGFVDGLAASMGSVVLMACNSISIPENAVIMVHKPWGIQGGDAHEMRRYADLLDKVEGSLVSAYVAKTGKTAEEIHAILEAETWMNGVEAVAAGFADKILEPVKAFAHINSKRMQEFTNMPTSAKNLFDPRGSVLAPTPAPTPAPPAADSAPAALTLDQMRAQVLAADGPRRTAITAAFCGSLGTTHTELLNTCLNDLGCTAEMAREKLLVALGSTTTPTGGPGMHGHVTNGNLVGDSVRASLAGRLGQAENQKDNAYNHMSLRELARASLHDRGILVATLDPMAMVGLAFTHDSSDFGNILVDSAAKSVLLGWDEAPETYHLWTKKGRLSDFKVASRVGMGAFPSLREVRPGAEYKYITTSDRGEKIRLATYGEMFSITRQAIINDDLDQLSTVPYNMGLAARGTIGDLVYDTLIHSPLMSDGKELFDAERNNLFTGAGSNMSIEALSKAKTAMALQKTQVEGGKARTLNIRPAFVLVPVALEDKTNQLIRSASVPGVDTNAGIDNPIRNFATVIAEPRLDDDSSTTWYQAARQGADTIEVAYLDGVEQPYLEQQQGFTIDGVASKVRIDAGVAALDYRGLNKSVGVVTQTKSTAR
ncbi:ClpP-like prohead protease/major capsid protein fusion protein [Pseudomonas sp. Irchel s3b6]|uniref:ClpP-like prohead protease/major capsid protein fusion protein n=1 Tax=Pseudomonas sp. Irchel s3b6 TaxID=2009078 RepID=UPI000BA30CA8|nr:ClpP-like prohead protease/major capsid protein fusion protein [Pseudomonas sp. Irchel s3b6]